MSSVTIQDGPVVWHINSDWYASQQELNNLRKWWCRREARDMMLSNCYKHREFVVYGSRSLATDSRWGGGKYTVEYSTMDVDRDEPQYIAHYLVPDVYHHGFQMTPFRVRWKDVEDRKNPDCRLTKFKEFLEDIFWARIYDGSRPDYLSERFGVPINMLDRYIKVARRLIFRRWNRNE